MLLLEARELLNTCAYIDDPSRRGRLRGNKVTVAFMVVRSKCSLRLALNVESLLSTPSSARIHLSVIRKWVVGDCRRLVKARLKVVSAIRLPASRCAGHSTQTEAILA